MTPGRRREVVDDLRDTWKGSIRRACSAIQAQRSSYLYKSRRPDRAPLRTRIREIAETRVRHGYRRIHVLLRREGWLVRSSW
jgi:putative transposase